MKSLWWLPILLVLVSALSWFGGIITVARKAKVIPPMTVQQECIARVGEIYAYNFGKTKPVNYDLSLALALCKEDERTANRVLVTLNKERPRYKDGRVK